ncbi:hypothetical protein D1W74_27370, partial [Salmonella enterica]|nr:hypothetical protein [Salmonella enterica]
CAVFNCGFACGEFLERLQSGDIEPLTTAAKALFGTLEHLGETLCEPVWMQAMSQGQHDVRADRAICNADADGWI